jgi:hypothetical protein
MATLSWKPNKPILPISASNPITERPDPRQELRPLLHALNDLAQNRGAGFEWKTGNSVPIQYSSNFAYTSDPTRYEEYVTFNHWVVQQLLGKIENWCYHIAIDAEVKLKFGDLVVEIFSEYRSSVLDVLAKHSINENLSAIEANVRNGTPEAAKLAILGCRNILLSLSEKLWQVAGLEKHPSLTDHKGRPLQVGPHQTKARLRAYLYEKGVPLQSSMGPTVASLQLDRISDVLDQLFNEMSETGKNLGTVEDAKSLTIQTFVLVGEMARLTDMEPVTSIGLAVSRASSSPTVTSTLPSPSTN